MSGIGASTCTLAVTRSLREILKSGTNFHRQAVSVTMTGHSPTAAANLALFLFRGGVEVANGGVFSGTIASALGSIDLNTTELELVMVGVAHGEARELWMRLYDGSTAEKLGEGAFDVIGEGTSYTDDMGADPSTPLEGTTVIWGKLAKYGGVSYGLNDDDGLWYPVSFRGPGGQIHLELGETGIVITE